MEAAAFPALLTRIFFLLLAGGLGAVSRYFLSVGLNTASWCGKPWGILLCNLLGCLLFGFLSEVLSRNFDPEVKLIVLTGFLGAFTTFSTFAFDSLGLLSEARYMAALANLLIHNVGGILMAAAGLALGKMLI